MQFRRIVHSPYDGDHSVSFFDPQANALSHLTVCSLDELGAIQLAAPSLPEAAGPQLRELMPGLLSPHAAVRAETVHRIADLGEAAIPALPWLLETAFYDDISIHDRQLRQTNARAQAQHALRRLSEIPTVAACLQALPRVEDPWKPPRTPPEPRPRLP